MKKIAYILILGLLLNFVSCKNEPHSEQPFVFSDDTVIITVENIDITYDLYRFYFLSMKENYHTLDEKSEVDLIEQCDKASLYYASMFIFADSKEIYLDSSDIEKIDEEISGYISFYGEDGYDQMLDSLNHTRNTYRNILKRQKLSDKCINELPYSSEQLEEIINQLVINLKYNRTNAYWHISFESVV